MCFAPKPKKELNINIGQNQGRNRISRRIFELCKVYIYTRYLLSRFDRQKKNQLVYNGLTKFKTYKRNVANRLYCDLIVPRELTRSTVSKQVRWWWLSRSDLQFKQLNHFLRSCRPASTSFSSIKRLAATPLACEQKTNVTSPTYQLLCFSLKPTLIQWHITTTAK